MHLFSLKMSCFSISAALASDFTVYSYLYSAGLCLFICHSPDFICALYLFTSADFIYNTYHLKAAFSKWVLSPLQYNLHTPNCTDLLLSIFRRLVHIIDLVLFTSSIHICRFHLQCIHKKGFVLHFGNSYIYQLYRFIPVSILKSGFVHRSLDCIIALYLFRSVVFSCSTSIIYSGAIESALTQSETSSIRTDIWLIFNYIIMY